MDQFFFTTPFAALGDQTSFPIATDPGGSVTFQQGWGPDYALDQDTDSNAKPIDRASTNYLMYVITNALAALQRVGIPEWITPANNNGVALPYPKYAQVRYSATSPGVTFATYVSVVDNNTSVPGADSNWQPILSIAAQAADVNSNSPSSSLTVTPAALQAYAGNSARTFLVAAATTAAMAAQAGQVQANGFNYAGAAGGTANALTASINPAPTAYTDDLVVVVRTTAANTAGVTLAVNGLAATAVVGQAHSALQGGELVANGFACFAYSTALAKFVLVWATGGAEQIGNATQSQQAVALGQLNNRTLKGSQTFTSSGTFTAQVTGYHYFSGCAGGGAGGGSLAGTTTGVIVAAAGGGGAGQSTLYNAQLLTAGQTVAITIGAGGTPNVGANGGSGGNTVVGTLFTLTGGSGGIIGAGGVSSSAYAGGPGGSGSPAGGSGSDTIGSYVGQSGSGGSGPFGGGGNQQRGAASQALTGLAAGGFGAGGGGAGGSYGGGTTWSASAGGAGSPGLMFVQW